VISELVLPAVTDSGVLLVPDGCRWPHLRPLAAATAAAGKQLLPRLPIYPEYILDLSSDGLTGGSSGSSSSGVCRWLSSAGSAKSVTAAVFRASDSSGLVRGNAWVAGMNAAAAAAAAADDDVGDEDRMDPAVEPRALQAAAGTRYNQQQQHQQQHQLQQQLKQQLQEPYETVRSAQQQIQAHQQQQQRPPVPLVRKQQSKLWSIAIDSTGILQDLPAPSDVAPALLNLLSEILEAAPAAAATARATCSSGSSSGSSSGGTSLESCGRQWQQQEVELLLSARGADLAAVVAAADHLRQVMCGDDVSYVVNRNINYTNVCTYSCRFCAFSKVGGDLPYRYSLDQCCLPAAAVSVSCNASCNAALMERRVLQKNWIVTRSRDLDLPYNRAGWPSTTP
jgi:FO synthase